jgi:pilus assembly protein CpaF
MFKNFTTVPPDARAATVPAKGPAAPVVPRAEHTVLAIRARPGGSDNRAELWTDLKVRLHQRLLDMINLSALDKIAVEDLRREVGAMVRELLVGENMALNAQEYAQLVEEILDEVLGLGPLEPLLKDNTVADILVNTYDKVFVERHGRLEYTPVKFKDDRHLLRIIDKIVTRIGRRVDESQPWVDARLPDGSRVNAIVPPCAVDGPLLSIRKFTRIPMTVSRLIETKSISAEMAELLKAIVRCRLNVLISGGTGSGKTTMLNAMSSFIGDDERIITIEDAAELQLQQFHVARMETRPANIEGKGEVTQRDLVRNALRMRPDRIIVGEVRGPEVLDMLQAMNTGHDGSMTTIHANSCRDALARMEQMIGMTGFDFPLKSMRSQVASALQVVLQLQRMNDGRRRLISIQEISGMEGDTLTMQEVFRFQRTATDANGNIIGHFEATGIRPHFAERFESWGIHLPPDIYAPNRQLGGIQA